MEARHVSSLVANLLRKLRETGLKRTLRYGRSWLSERFHERRLGIDSEYLIPLDELGVHDLL
jgi:hypothetical protein